MDDDERRPPSSSSTSSSRSEHDRRLSGDQRRPPSRQDSRLSTEDPRRRAPSGGNSERRKQSTESDFTLPPSKPQLTQELENQIISGGDVFMKKKRRERIGRQQEERDREKMTREEKLAQVPYSGGRGLGDSYAFWTTNANFRRRFLKNKTLHPIQNNELPPLANDFVMTESMTIDNHWISIKITYGSR